MTVIEQRAPWLQLRRPRRASWRLPAQGCTRTGAPLSRSEDRPRVRQQLPRSSPAADFALMRTRAPCRRASTVSSFPRSLAGHRITDQRARRPRRSRATTLVQSGGALSLDRDLRRDAATGVAWAYEPSAPCARSSHCAVDFGDHLAPRCRRCDPRADGGERGGRPARQDRRGADRVRRCERGRCAERRDRADLRTGAARPGSPDRDDG